MMPPYHPPLGSPVKWWATMGVYPVVFIAIRESTTLEQGQPETAAHVWAPASACIMGGYPCLY